MNSRYQQVCLVGLEIQFAAGTDTNDGCLQSLVEKGQHADDPSELEKPQHRKCYHLQDISNIVILFDALQLSKWLDFNGSQFPPRNNPPEMWLPFKRSYLHDTAVKQSYLNFANYNRISEYNKLFFCVTQTTSTRNSMKSEMCQNEIKRSSHYCGRKMTVVYHML